MAINISSIAAVRQPTQNQKDSSGNQFLRYCENPAASPSWFGKTPKTKEKSPSHSGFSPKLETRLPQLKTPWLNFAKTLHFLPM
jgi:hypothetical protein